MRRLTRAVLSLALVALAAAGCTSSTPGPRTPLVSAAAVGPASLADLTTPVVATRAYSAIVVDVATGKVLHDEAAEELRRPASLTKMMTLYLLFEQLEAGRLFVTSELSVSANAASKPPTKIGLRAGGTIKVEDAIKALAVRSANDVATTVAENLAGSEPDFALAMTRKARQLGMRQTQFANASGLPDPRNVTTARDMAILGKALSDRFPRYFHYFSTPRFSWGGRTWVSTNKLLPRVRGVDGIKTGFVNASGFNLVTSVRRDGRHLVAVVMGGRTGASRDRRMEELIEQYLPDRSAPVLAVAPAPVAAASAFEPPVVAEVAPAPAAEGSFAGSAASDGAEAFAASTATDGAAEGEDAAFAAPAPEPATYAAPADGLPPGWGTPG